MHYLFDEMPYLEGDRLVLRPFVIEDKNSLLELTQNDNVYKYLPTFLYEQKYNDKEYVISHMKEECFDTKESILLAITFKDKPDVAIGIAEIYNYEKDKEKASIGYRINEKYWHLGVATETACLLVKYLINETDVRKITAHVMTNNIASRRVCEKSGFVDKWPNLVEDWGREVIVDKYSYKISSEEKEKILKANNN